MRSLESDAANNSPRLRLSTGLTVRREIDRAVYDLRLEIATACARKADECGEPPLDDDAA